MSISCIQIEDLEDELSNQQTSSGTFATDLKTLKVYTIIVLYFIFFVVTEIIAVLLHVFYTLNLTIFIA